MASKGSKVGSPKTEKGQESLAPKTVDAPKKEKKFVASKSNEFEPSYSSKTYKIDNTIEVPKQTPVQRQKHR